MASVYFHPDISNQDLKIIESKYNKKDTGYLINKASDFICEILSKKIKKKQKIVFICGPGSNGLDGIYSSYKLNSLGYDIRIFLLNSNNDSVMKKLSISNKLIKKLNLENFDYVVDCMFGYGLNRELTESHIELVREINESKAYVYSIDIPSGLNPNTGKLCPVSIKCNTLISLLNYKRGLFTNHGRDTWDELVHTKLVSENIDSDDYLISANHSFSGYCTQKQFNLEKIHAQHKKSNGISCIISGQHPYHGALILSCKASIKVGTKYLHVYTDDEYAHSLPMIIPEIIALPFSEKDFLNNLSKYRNILIGPGTDDITDKFVEIISKNLDNFDSIIVDAGALKYLKKYNLFSDKLIITPHPGEAADLLNVNTEEIQLDRYKSAKALHQIYKCIVILKGSGTIIYDGKKFFTCMDGNYRMAVAGMGDTLAGILLYELSSSRSILHACIKAVTYHSYSADYLLNNSKIKNYLPSMIPDIYDHLTNI